MAIHAPTAHNIVQCVKFTLPQTSVSVPAYGNASGNYRQWGSYSVSITPKFANSHIRIIQHCTTHNVTSHGYLSWKRGGTGGTFLHTEANGSSDGLFCNHDGDSGSYESSVVIWEDGNASYSLGNSLTYVPYVGMWSATTLYFGSYASNGNAETRQGFHGYLEEIAYS